MQKGLDRLLKEQWNPMKWKKGRYAPLFAADGQLLWCEILH